MVVTIFVVVRVQSIIFAYLKYFCKNNARRSNIGSGYNVPVAMRTLKVYRKTEWRIPDSKHKTNDGKGNV